MRKIPSLEKIHKKIWEDVNASYNKALLFTGEMSLDPLVSPLSNLKEEGS